MAVGHAHTQINLGQTIKLLKSKFHFPLELNMSQTFEEYKIQSVQVSCAIIRMNICNRNCGVLPSSGILLSPLGTASLLPSFPHTADQC